MNFEWVLATPKMKDFKVMVPRTVIREVPKTLKGGLPVLTPVETQVFDEAVVTKPANVVRLATVANDRNYQRLAVRFVYGFIDVDGTYRLPILDDGIAFSGPSYIEHNFYELDHANVDEADLLRRIGTFLKWDGSMRPYTA